MLSFRLELIVSSVLIVVGEIGILFDVVRTATVVAKTNCTLLTLTAEKVSQKLLDYPKIRKTLRQSAHLRLVSLTKEYERNGKTVPTDIMKQIDEFVVATV